MQTGQCPKCASATVYQRASGVGDMLVHVRTGFVSIAVPVMSYVCTTCGYFEQYIDDARKLAEVAQTWNHVLRRP